MRIKRIFLSILLLQGILFAQEAVFAPNGWSFNVVSDFLYSPKSPYVQGKMSDESSGKRESHFAPITGAFDNFQNRERFHAVYLLHTPIGENPLFQYSNFSIDLGLELTVIDAAPMFSATFMPLPLFYVSAGGIFGTGWPVFGMDTVAVLDKERGEWNGLKPFINDYYEFWFSGNFQFDFGAIFPGEWSHVITTASYKVIYKGMTGMKKGDIWSWQGEPNYTNGWQQFQNYMAGYHFPKAVNFLGIITNIYGYYDSSVYGKEGSAYKGNFNKIDINPVIEFLCGKETIDFLVDFSSRRSFVEAHENMKEEVFLTCNGREWYLRSFILSWKHKF